MLTDISRLYSIGTHPSTAPFHLCEELVRIIAVELTYDPCHQTQNDSDGDECPVPGVRSIHRGHTQKDED